MPDTDTDDSGKDVQAMVGFYAWPAEHGWEQSMYALFRTLPRIEMEMTEAEWPEFSASLERQGITVREVEHFTSEPVMEPGQIISDPDDYIGKSMIAAWNRGVSGSSGAS